MKILSDYQSENGVVISAIVKFRFILSPIPHSWEASNISFNNEVFDNNIDEDAYITYVDSSGDYYVHIGTNDTIFNINPQYREDDTYKRTFNEIFDEIYKKFGYSGVFTKLQCTLYKITNKAVNILLANQYDNTYGRMGLSGKCNIHVYSNNGEHAIESIDTKVIREAWTFDKIVSKIASGDVFIFKNNYHRHAACA